MFSIGLPTRVSRKPPRNFQARAPISSSSLINTARAQPNLRWRPSTFRSPSVSLIHAHLPRRQFSSQLRTLARTTFQKHPFMFPLGLLSAILSFSAFTYVVYYQIFHVRPQFSKFPPPVEQALRRAIYWTEIDLHPFNATKAYREALELAEQTSMDPFSDEVLGIRFNMMGMLEKAGRVKEAIQVLEGVRGEALEWYSEGVRMKLLREKGAFGGDGDNMEQKTQEDEAKLDQQRERVLAKVVETGVKLSELYSSDYIQDDAKVETSLIQAVEIALKEYNWRQQQGLDVGEGNNFLGPLAIATACSRLADLYLNKGEYDLSGGLYGEALRILNEADKDPSCEKVMILGNVSASLFHESINPPPRREGAPARPTKQELRDMAEKFGLAALADSVRCGKMGKGTEDCLSASIATSYNLGELQESEGKLDSAQSTYADSAALATGVIQDEKWVRKQEAEEALKLAMRAMERVRGKMNGDTSE